MPSASASVGATLDSPARQHPVFELTTRPLPDDVRAAALLAVAGAIADGLGVSVRDVWGRFLSLAPGTVVADGVVERVERRSGRLINDRPVEDLDGAVRRCRARKLKEEGIEMYLALEDADGRPLAAAPGDPDGEVLARLARGYVAGIAADPEAPSERAVSCAFEVLAAHHFVPLEDA